MNFSIDDHLDGDIDLSLYERTHRIMFIVLMPSNVEDVNTLDMAPLGVAAARLLRCKYLSGTCNCCG